jgi:hypothetical protein
LWRELADGSASSAVRAFVTFALAVALTGLVPIVAYFLAASVPAWNRYSVPGVYPADELVAALAVLAGGALLAASAWLWTRSGRRRPVLAPIFQTIGVAAAAVVLGLAAAESLPGDNEMVVNGLILLAVAALILIWLRVVRRGPHWRPLRDPQDGLPDVRCPACGYRMVGLTESRCPECGVTYTLDELIAKQGFAPPPPSAASTPPPIPPAAAALDSPPPAATPAVAGT